MEGFDCLSALQKVWCRCGRARIEQQSTGLLYLNGFKSPIDDKNTHTPKGVWVFLAEQEGFVTFPRCGN